MKVYVSMKVVGEYIAEIEVDDITKENIEMAKYKAIDDYMYKADFKDLGNPNGEIVLIEDENGKCLYKE